MSQFCVCVWGGGSLGDGTILSLYSRNDFLNMGNFRISSVALGDNLASWKENVMLLSVHVTLWREGVDGCAWQSCSNLQVLSGHSVACLERYSNVLFIVSGDRKDDCLLGILAAGNPPQQDFFRKQPLVIGTSQSAFSTKHFRTLVDK